jgi:hypothetical protein
MIYLFLGPQEKLVKINEDFVMLWFYGRMKPQGTMTETEVSQTIE